MKFTVYSCPARAKLIRYRVEHPERLFPANTAKNLLFGKKTPVFLVFQPFFQLCCSAEKK